MGYKVAAAVLFICTISAVAQTSSDLEKKYGKPINSYVVSEHILMTPEYSTDGQLCMVRLHPRHYGPHINYVSANLPFSELMKVLNELVPVRTRGAKKEPFDTGAAGGGVEWMTYAYQNVEFSFVSSFRPDPDSWKTRKEFVFTIEPGSSPAQSEPKSAPSDVDFSPSQGSIIELVTIKWSGKPCGK